MKIEKIFSETNSSASGWVGEECQVPCGRQRMEPSRSESHAKSKDLAGTK